MPTQFTAFDGPRRLATGSRFEAAMALRDARDRGADGPLLVFDDSTGAEVDFDPRGSETEIATRFADPPDDEPRGRGRPKLGVVAREVTLLPRHWEWLAAQTGGASVALRRLVEEARRADAGATEARQAKAAAFKFLSAMAGDRPGFEEAIRAMFADDKVGFADRARPWPRDIVEHATRLAFGAAEIAT